MYKRTAVFCARSLSLCASMYNTSEMLLEYPGQASGAQEYPHTTGSSVWFCLKPQWPQGLPHVTSNTAVYIFSGCLCEDRVYVVLFTAYVPISEHNPDHRLSAQLVNLCSMHDECTHIFRMATWLYVSEVLDSPQRLIPRK